MEKGWREGDVKRSRGRKVYRNSHVGILEGEKVGVIGVVKAEGKRKIINVHLIMHKND